MDKQERWYLDSIDLTDAVVADVGANVGRLSQFFWDHGKGRKRVVSIEPVPENVARISERIEAANAGDAWTVEHCAVSDHDGEVEIHMFDLDDEARNSVVVDASRPAPPSSVRVPCRTLPSLIPDATVVKVDIEGHEYAVMREAVGAMDRAKAWAVELHLMPQHPLEATIALFESHGFSVVAATMRPGDSSGKWHSVPVTPALTWAQIPVAKKNPDGSVFKMLHVIARRGD